MAATRKQEKYVDLGARYIFEPIAVESLGVFNTSARHHLGRRIFANLGEAQETSYLHRRISFWCSTSIQKPLPERSNCRGSRPSTLETDVYIWHYALLVVHASVVHLHDHHRLHRLMIVLNFVFSSQVFLTSLDYMYQGSITIVLILIKFCFNPLSTRTLVQYHCLAQCTVKR